MNDKIIKETIEKKKTANIKLKKVYDQIGIIEPPDSGCWICAGENESMDFDYCRVCGYGLPEPEIEYTEKEYREFAEQVEIQNKLWIAIKQSWAKNS